MEGSDNLKTGAGSDIISTITNYKGNLTITDFDKATNLSL